MPAFAQPHVIAQLGTAPLIGQISSTSQLQADVQRQRQLFEAAGDKLGLTTDEYARFEQRIALKQLTYVTLPHHLDAMSWSSGGKVYVLRDVVIPAGTKGWEIDLREDTGIVALFIPARCGNLSIVRKPLPAIARTIVPWQPIVEADATTPPAPPASSTTQTQAVAVPPTPAATPAPYESAAASSGPAHHVRWWPLLLIPVAAFFFHGGGGTANVPSLTPVTSVAPTPQPVVGCTPPPSH